MKSRLVIFLFIFNSSLSNYAQSLYRMNNVPIYHNSKQLKSPFTGGMHASIVNQMDLNKDGKKDLVIVQHSYDRINRIQTYLQASNEEYIYTPKYEAFFPKNINAVFQLVDMNEDNMEDIIFKTSSEFILFYGSRSSDTTFQFSLHDTIHIISYDPLYGKQLLSVINLSFPIWRDFDQDGDIDIVYLKNGSGKRKFLFKNYKKEKALPANTNEFYIENVCWGQYRDTLNPLKFIDGDCPAVVRGEREEKKELTPRHDEYQMVWELDINHDGLYDVISYSENQKNAPLGINTGTKDSAYIKNSDTYFPSYSKPINRLMSNGFWLDVNNDGNKDILSSYFIERDNSGTFIYQKLYNDDVATISYYKNSGKKSKPDAVDGKVQDSFEWISDSFLSEETIDVGTGSAPVFFNYDKDSLVDLLIPNIIKRDSWEVSSIAYYRNIGSKSQPQYKLANKDLLNYKAKSRANIKIATGDLNGDGIEDLLISSHDKATWGSFASSPIAEMKYELYYFVSGGIIQTDTIAIDYVDKYGRSNMVLYDVNSDGKLDLFIGDVYSLKYYKNRGTNAKPSFPVIDCDSVINPLDIYPYLYQYQFFPSVWKDAKDGKSYLLFGYYFNGGKIGKSWIDTAKLNANRSLPILNKDIYPNLSININPTISLKDVTNDNIDEVLFGNYAGGVQLFSLDSLTGVKDPPPPPLALSQSVKSADIFVYPNPVENELKIITPVDLRKSQIRVFSIEGKLVLERTMMDTHTSIDISFLHSGIYILHIYNENHGDTTFRIQKK